MEQILACARSRRDSRYIDIVEKKEARATIIMLALMGSGNRRALLYFKRFMSLIMVAYGATGPIRDFLSSLGLGATNNRLAIMKELQEETTSIKKLSIIMLDNNQRNFKHIAKSYSDTSSHSVFHSYESVASFFGSPHTLSVPLAPCLCRRK